MKSNIVVVDGDDWMGLYVNGVLIDEGHEIHVKDLCFHITKANPIGTLVYRQCDPDWIYEAGNFPSKIEEVVFDD